MQPRHSCTRSGSRVAPLVLACLALALAAPAMSTETVRKDPQQVGTRTQTWLEEQRNGINRADPEPWPAERAAAALRKYEASVGSSGDSGAGAARSGSGIVSRNPASTGSSSGATSTPTVPPGLGSAMNALR